jgi:hypothetical protein
MENVRYARDGAELALSVIDDGPRTVVIATALASGDPTPPPPLPPDAALR